MSRNKDQEYNNPLAISQPASAAISQPASARIRH